MLGAFQPIFKALSQEQIKQQFVDIEVINHAEKCSMGCFLAQPCQSTQEFRTRLNKTKYGQFNL